METKTPANSASANSHAGDPLADLHQRLSPHLEQVEDRLQATNERVMAFVRQNPGTCLLGAAALGFLAGSWASRR